MGVTWYLAADMQLFIISPIFVYVLWRWWKIGLGWTVFAIASVLGATIAIFIVWELQPTTSLSRA